ncbi:MAG: agarase [Rariglobus sp.]|jgi:agarase|nr:agarase [Rariglobus sp.]
MSSSFIRLEKRNDRWWLIDPDGRPFVSKGINSVRFDADKIQKTSIAPYAEHSLKTHGSLSAWQRATVLQLEGWNVNTLGAWSDLGVAHASGHGRPLTYCVILNLGAEFVRTQARDPQQAGAWLHGLFPDVFAPEFATFVYEAADRQCREHKANPALLGWFVDNELRWGPDWRSSIELLVVFLHLPPGAPGREAAHRFLPQRYSSINVFNAVWKTSFRSWTELAASAEIPPPWTRAPLYAQTTAIERARAQAEPAFARFVADCDAFLGVLAEEYFRITSAALKAAAPRQLNLGCRFAYVPPAPVLAAAARHVDVVSFNCYERDPLPTVEIYGACQKPLLIGEFSFRSEDSGLPNTQGAGPWVKTQEERAAAFEHYVRRALEHPNVVGYHWFKHVDQPREGRFDGENSNYGLLTIDGKPYEPFVQTVTRVNALAESLHDTPAPVVAG